MCRVMPRHLKAVGVCRGARKQVPVNVRRDVSVTRIIHFPRLERCGDRFCRTHQFGEQFGLNARIECVHFRHMLFEQKLRVAS